MTLLEEYENKIKQSQKELNQLKRLTPMKIDPRYLKRLKELEGSIQSGYPEFDHPEADEILCNILKDLGFEEIVEAYNKVPKWYS